MNLCLYNVTYTISKLNLLKYLIFSTKNKKQEKERKEQTPPDPQDHQVISFRKYH